MGLYIQLHILGLMLITKIYSFKGEDHPILLKVLESLGIYSDTPMSVEEVKKCFFIILNNLESRFVYYTSSDLKTNLALNQYLGHVFSDMKNGTYERAQTLAVGVCGSGNRNGAMTYSDGVSVFTEEAKSIIEKLAMLYSGEEELQVEILRAYIRQLEYIDKVLELTDVFVTSRMGALAGADEYPASALEDLDESPEPDFSIDGLECKSETDCQCGCQLDHPLKVIEGMEDFLNGDDTPAREYFIGVAGANNIRLEQYTGNEGPIFDAIKDLGVKAWNALTASLGAIKEMFTTSNPEDKVKAAETAADNNKKALQSMKSTAAVINDKAREGITNLMADIDPSGKLKTLVSQLRTPSDGPKVIDALMGFMSKEATSAGKLNKEIAAAQKAVGEIKTAAGDTAGDESNKDVAAAKKAKVQSKVKTGKESLKTVKFELAAHHKLMQGIQKAIAGISPKIFIKDEEEKKKEGKKDE